MLGRPGREQTPWGSWSVPKPPGSSPAVCTHPQFCWPRSAAGGGQLMSGVSPAPSSPVPTMWVLLQLTKCPFSPSFGGKFLQYPQSKHSPPLLPTLPQHLQWLLSTCQPQACWLALPQPSLALGISGCRLFFFHFLIPPCRMTKVKPAVMHHKHSCAPRDKSRPRSRRTTALLPPHQERAASPPGSRAMALPGQVPGLAKINPSTI